MEVAQPHVEALLPALLHCASDTLYKVASEALLALQQLIKIVQSGELGMEEHENTARIAQEIYPVVLHQLKATGIDQQVKEIAMTTVATLLTHLGSYLRSEWSSCIPIFVEGLKIEATCLTALKTFNLMASSELVDLDLCQFMPEVIPVLASFLRKNERVLRLATLNLLDTLIRRYSHMDEGLFQNVIKELSPLLLKGDVHCAEQALQLMTSLAVHQPQALAQAGTICMSAVKLLLRSPLILSAASVAFIDFPRAFFHANIPTFSSGRLESYFSLAKCIAVISVSAGEQEAITVARSFISDLSRPEILHGRQIVMALMSVGEIGRQV